MDFSLFKPVRKIEDVEDLLEEEGWGLQEKHDGKRVLIVRFGGTTTAYSRTGNEVPLNLYPNWLPVIITYEVDGELVKEGTSDVFHAFDLLSLNGVDLRSMRYENRLEILMNTFHEDYVPRTYITHSDKMEALSSYLRGGKEGVIFRNMRGKWTGSRSDSNGYKLKFIQSASVLAGKQNGDKQSCYIQMYYGVELQTVGKVKIPEELLGKQEGKILEVQYLYATSDKEGYHLVQPIFLKVRDDITEADRVDSLKLKGGGK